MIDTKEMEKHIEELQKQIEILDKQMEVLDDKKWNLVNEIRELNLKIKETQRNAIEYHKGDLLVRFNRGFAFHDTICHVYEILKEIPAKNTRTTVQALEITLNSYDSEIYMKTNFTRDLQLVNLEEDEDIYYVKSSALKDLLLVFHELSITGVPDKTEEMFNRLEEVIGLYDGKKLIDVIAETNKYRNESEGND